MSRPASFYLMESELETQRLIRKTDYEETARQLFLTGLADLPEFPKVLDAGCGAGAVSQCINQILISKYKGSELFGADLSQARIEDAEKLVPVTGNHSFKGIVSKLERLPVPENTFDYIFCRFVFEYLENQKVVFQELLRILKPGGVLVVGDLDFNCLVHHGCEQELQDQLNELMSQLVHYRYLDPYAGRRLYSYFHQNKLANIRIEMTAHHLFYGKLDKRDRENWLSKLDQMAAMQASGKIRLSFDVKKFGHKFMTFLEDEARFSYTPLILTWGKKGEFNGK